MHCLSICLLFGLTLVVCSAITQVQDLTIPCPEIRCLKERKCPFGYKRINGCPTCECNRPYHCPYYRPCQQWLKCPSGFVEINGCPTCMCKPTPKPTTRPPFCLTCCGPPPCCNYCGLDKPTTRPPFCLTCCGPPPCCNYCGMDKPLAK